MTPLTVTAYLATPPVLDRPVCLDGVLLGATGAAMSAAAGEWLDDATVIAHGLPLARVETVAGWWWAASALLPWGPEQRGDLNRVPLVDEAARWTTARTITQGSGPDKRLRVPYYTRPAMLSLTWTCVGDADAVGRLLLRARGIGRHVKHGHGWVTRWSVERGGPAVEEYGRSLELRHLPVALEPALPVGRDVGRRRVPLRAPYHALAAAVPCWQVTA